MDVATRPVDHPLVICGLNIAHILMQEKKVFTLAETVIKPCLEIVAKHVHGGDVAVSEVKKIPLSSRGRHDQAMP